MTSLTFCFISVAKDLYSNLGNQINHKINFIQTHIPKTCDLTLVGHSIGCKMSLEVMRHFQREDPERKIKGFFLFPTIERMRETPSGRGVWIVVTKSQSKSPKASFHFPISGQLFYPTCRLSGLLDSHLGARVGRQKSDSVAFETTRTRCLRFYHRDDPGDFEPVCGRKCNFSSSP